MKKFNMKKLSLAVATSFAFLTSALTSVQASDIQIYQEAQLSNTTLVFMLDISGSMDERSITQDYTASSFSSSLTERGFGNYNRTYKRIHKNNIAGSTIIPEQCVLGSDSYYKCYDRMSRLKDAFYLLLNGGTDLKGDKIERLSNDKIIGLSTLGVKTSYSPYYKDTGQMLVPALRLDDKSTGKEHRQVLTEALEGLTASTNTPTARSFAEVVSYFMGTNTKTVPNGYSTSPIQYVYIPNIRQKYQCAERFPRACSNISFIEVSDEPSNIHKINSVTVTINSVAHPAYVYTTEKGMGISGFDDSPISTKNGTNNYKSPILDSSKCSAYGVYVLTDGEPTQDTGSEGLYNSAFNDSFTCSDTNSSLYCAINASEKLLLGNNVKNTKVKTAVVGFGSVFSKVTSYNPSLTEKENLENIGVRNNDLTTLNNDPVRAAAWGIKGGGGWYSGASTQSVVGSVNSFLNQLTTEIPQLTTGSPTIPVDALNRLNILSEGYYGSLKPTPEKDYRIWEGDMSKYKIVKGEFVDRNNRKIFDAKGNLNGAAVSVWGTGAKDKLPLKADIKDKSRRFIYTDRTNQAKSGNSLTQVSLDTLYGAPFSGDSKRIELLNLLGYNVDSVVARDQLQSKPELRQLGAVMHSTPVLLTQEGIAETQVDRDLTITFGSYTSEEDKRRANELLNATVLTQAEVDEIKRKLLAGDADMIAKYGNYTTPEEKAAVDARLDIDLNTKIYTDAEIEDIKRRLTAMSTRDQRKDYLMYGSTQGLLHIVDAKTGIEKLAFVPNEMINNQSDTFKSINKTTGGKSNLYYGVDGPWTSYAQYIEMPKKPDVYTVYDETLTDKTTDLTGKGFQWVYGGLRMGGRSYYALDLSNLDAPKLKFSIIPDNFTTGPLSYMGQSWSKPTIGYVNWKGSPKLVMFVGGGYDMGYEASDFAQTTATKGAGVYMFDANNGELLWWTSAHVANSTVATNDPVTVETKAPDMKHSIVSQINAIDLNNDGLFDNLYFGDLGGQAWRVDINNTAEKTGGFVTRVQRIFVDRQSGETIDNARKKTNKPAPRFYEMPSVSIQNDPSAGMFVTVAFSSGDRSSPLAGDDREKGLTNTLTAEDATYVFYDRDVLSADLHSSKMSFKNMPATTAFASWNGTSGVPLAGNIGWKYTYKQANDKSGRYKGINGIYSISSVLYTNIYDRDGDGIGGGCGAGVRGNTKLYSFCLPFGNCSSEIHGIRMATATPPSSDQGPGISGHGLGVFDKKGDDVILGPSGPFDHGECAKNPSKPKCGRFKSSLTFQKLRWYESH